MENDMKINGIAERYEDLAKMIIKLNEDSEAGLEYVLRKGDYFLSEADVRDIGLSFKNNRVIDTTKELMLDKVLIEIAKVDKELKEFFTANKKVNADIVHTIDRMKSFIDGNAVFFSEVESFNVTNKMKLKYRGKLLENTDILIDEAGERTNAQMLEKHVFNLKEASKLRTVVNSINDMCTISINVVNNFTFSDKNQSDKIDDMNRTELSRITLGDLESSDISTIENELMFDAMNAMISVKKVFTSDINNFVGYSLDRLQGKFNLENDRMLNEFLIKQVITIRNSMDKLFEILGLVDNAMYTLVGIYKTVHDREAA